MLTDEVDLNPSMAVMDDIEVGRDPAQRPRAASDVSEHPSMSPSNDSGIDSSSPRSSNFSSIDALESRRGMEIDGEWPESDMQLHSDTMSVSSIMPRDSRRRRGNQNEIAAMHTKKPRSS